MFNGLKSLLLSCAILIVSSTGVFAQQPADTPAPASPDAAKAGQPASTEDENKGKENKPDEEQEEVDQAAASASGIIKALSDKGLIDTATFQDLTRVINGLAKSTRLDQTAIYNFVRAVNRNIDLLGETCDRDCDQFVADVRETNRKLMHASYADGLFQNKNLSHQIHVRLPLLIADSATLAGNRPGNSQNAVPLVALAPQQLQGQTTVSQQPAQAQPSSPQPPRKLSKLERESLMRDFADELDLLSQKYLSARRFRAGIGLSYSYLPTVRYQDMQRVDFSPFQTEAAGGADRAIFNTEFDNRSLPALLVSAKVPFVQLDLSIPNAKHTQTIVTPVHQRPGDADNDLLVRTTVEAELAVEYEASLKLSMMDVFNAIGGYRCRKRAEKAPAQSLPRLSACGPRNYQYDYGIGVGMTGLRVKNAATTDVRFRTDPNTTFNDLPPGATINTQNSSTFNTVFISLHGAFRITDEFQIGLEARQYRKNTSSERAIDVSDTTLTLSAVWYPTLDWF